MKMELIDQHGDANSDIPHLGTEISGSSKEQDDPEYSLTDQNSS